jgi:phosphatidylglycerol:prolipoprotein diacylglycerol transferase
MYPILLTVGSWKLRANLVFFILGCVAGVILGIREVKKIKGLPSYSRINLIVSFSAGIAFAYFVGRLNGGLFAVIYQKWAWRTFAFSGIISFGAILGGLLYGFLVSKIFKISTGKIMDLIALMLPLIEGIYRIGCILNGCCYGREAAGFGAMYLPEVHGVWAYRYPTQIMLMVFNLLLFLWLWRRSSKEIVAGSQTIYFLVLYSLGRFIIDFFRADLPMVGALGFHQIASIVIFCMTILGYLVLRKSNRI